MRTLILLAIGCCALTAARADELRCFGVGSMTLEHGSGYTPGTYAARALVGGSGSGATATLTVGAGGQVDDVAPLEDGTGYAAGDVLTADIGPGNGFRLTVDDVQSHHTDDPRAIANAHKADHQRRLAAMDAAAAGALMELPTRNKAPSERAKAGNSRCERIAR